MVVGQFSTTVDVAVIGGGPAGLAAALEARARGRSVAVVMHGGGSRLARAGADPLLAACRAAEIDLLDGDAVLDGDRQLRIPSNVGVPRLRFRRLVLAPDLDRPGASGERDGSTPNGVSAAAPRTIGSWSRGLPAETPPAAGAVALVRGGGPAECTAAARLAVRGWAAQLAPGGGGLLPSVDDPVRAATAAMLRAAGVTLLTPALAAAAEGEAEPPSLVVDGIGLVPRVDGLGLEAVAVDLSSGRVAVDEHLRTGDPRILAAGAAVAGPATEGRWMRQGTAAGATAAGEAEPFDEPVPLYLVPLGDLGFVAWCGLSEADAAAAGVTIRIAAGSAGPQPAALPDPDAEAPVDAADAAATCRLLVDEGGLVVGASLVARAPEAAARELLLAVEMAAEPGDLAGIARDPGDLAAVAIDRAARAALARRFAAPAAAPGGAGSTVAAGAARR